jgi:hypothetical protein
MTATTTTDTKAPAMTLERAFDHVCTWLKKRGPDAQKRVMAHLRAVTGRSRPLPGYHADQSIPEEEKKEQYRLILRAIIDNNYSILQGQQAQATPPEVEKFENPKTAAVQKKRAAQGTTPEPPQESTTRDSVNDPEVEVKSEEQDELTQLLLRRLQPHLKPSAAPVDADQVREIVRDHLKDVPTGIDEQKVADIALETVKHAMSNGEFPEDRVKKLIDAAMANACVRIDLTDASGQVRSVGGLYHWQLPQIITWVNADIPVWLWSAAGAGKTFLPRQIGEALNLPYFTFSIDPTTTVGKLLGFKNLTTGEFVQGWLYAPYKDGGVILLDELDTGDPGVLAALNALLANDEYTFPNSERVKRNANLRIIVGANTKGCGAVAGYTARNRLDAATLDRFAVIEMQYDQELEFAIATGAAKPPGKSWSPGEKAGPTACERWVQWVQSVRKNVGASVLVSPRASINGAKALRAGVPAGEVADALVFRFCTEDTKRNIVSACGTFAL